MEATKVDIRAEVRHVNDQFEKSFNKGDAASIGALYTSNGMLLPTGSDIIKGREAISNFWQGAMNMGIKSVKLESLEVELCNETAIETGAYTLSGSEKELIDKGKYMVIWKRENGDWKIQKDIWNSSIPVQ